MQLILTVLNTKIFKASYASKSRLLAVSDTKFLK
jgi:hypothetical protein